MAPSPLPNPCCYSPLPIYKVARAPPFFHGLPALAHPASSAYPALPPSLGFTPFTSSPSAYTVALAAPSVPSAYPAFTHPSAPTAPLPLAPALVAHPGLYLSGVCARPCCFSRTMGHGSPRPAKRRLDDPTGDATPSCGASPDSTVGTAPAAASPSLTRDDFNSLLEAFRGEVADETEKCIARHSKGVMDSTVALLTKVQKNNDQRMYQLECGAATAHTRADKIAADQTQMWAQIHSLQAALEVPLPPFRSG